MSDFVDVHLNNKNLDSYHIRNSIFKALESTIPYFKGNLLDVGCGKMPYRDFIIDNSEVKEYVGLDIEFALEYDKYIKPDMFWDGSTMPILDETYDTVIATEVLEHCFEPEVVLREIFRVLKPNGVFFFTVPFLWNLHETPYDAYRYTPYALERHLKNSGFNNIKLNATGGWHASMAQMIGLWICRNQLTPIKRKILSFIGKPIIKFLLNMDKPENVTFTDGQMITGLFGVIKKTSSEDFNS